MEHRNWENFSIEENVKFINTKLLEGLTMKCIEENIYSVADRVIVKRLNRIGYKRSTDKDRLFILADKNKAITKPNKPIKKADVIQQTHNTNTILSDEEIKDFKELIKYKNELINLINKDYKEPENHNININVIQTTETKLRQFRIDKEVLDQWTKFCNEHREIKVQNLISTALMEFINKYK